MSSSSDLIRARLEEHDEKDMIDCSAQYEGLTCCVDKKVFNHDTHKWEDNPFRVALETILENQATIENPKVEGEIVQPLKVHLYDHDGVLLGVFPVRSHVKNGDTITLSFPVHI